MCSGSQNLQISLLLKASISAGPKGDVPKTHHANVHYMCYFWSKLSGNFRNLFALLVAQQVSEILPPSKYFTSWCSAQSLPSRDLILSLLRSTKIITIFYKNYWVTFYCLIIEIFIMKTAFNDYWKNLHRYLIS